MTLEDDVRQLVIDGEHAAREARYPLKQKAALQPQYELYLKFLSRSQQPKVPRADDYLRVVAAMRDEQTFADLDFLNGSELPSVEHIAGSPLRILAAYLERLEGTIVFIIERGAGVLTLFALRSEGSSLEERVALERASKTCVDALIGLMRLQDDNIRRIGRREQISKAFFEPIEQAAAQVWDAMPAAIRDAITDARSVLYLPSTFGDLNTFPLELIRTKEGWLGITRSIARLSSLRTLLELLSPNRSPSKLDAKAVVVRAADSKELTNADAEATSVYRQLKDLGFETEIDREPRVATLRSALDRGLRVMHYCGHGYAGKLGELLPLAENEMLGPHDFSQLSGWGTPFVYLSTCEVGRARMTTTGNAIGVAIRLIEKGAPAVIACLETVPDMIAHSMAVSFYKTAMKLPLGEALVAARKEHLKFPPVCWGAFSYFGDPDLQLITVDGVVPQTRRQTLRWDTLVGRHLAIRSSESRQRVLDAIAIARTSCVGDKDTLLKQVVSWVEKSFRAEDP
ncbi:MAG: CHAT domain-containing protein, partial [Sulfuricella sp.]